MKVAIVADYLTQKGGAERVVGVLHRMYPDAPIYTSVLNKEQLWDDLKDADIRTTWMQYLPGIKRHFKLFFWLYPFAFRSICIREYDIVISSSCAYAKGVRLEAGANGNKPVHICYCHTPMRFAWDFERYIAKETRFKILKTIARIIILLLRRWDLAVNENVDIFIANSNVVLKRIQKIYQRDATVIYPPVDIERFLNNPVESDKIIPEPYFLVVSRLVSYKRIDLAVEACTKLGQPLFVIGEGSDRKRLESLAGPSIRFLGWQSEEVTRSYMTKCTAFIFPGEEDFGITPVEVNAAGRPVIAYHAGGALDTVIDGVTGIFFKEQDVDSLTEAIERVNNYSWDPQYISEQAKRFERNTFEKSLIDLVQSYNKYRTE